ncbi:MAG: EAL domain-containing protein [Clostridiales bacterium]|nr:MAG: EAL domain-containing protein [Clostridiales bacterium]
MAESLTRLSTTKNIEKKISKKIYRQRQFLSRFSAVLRCPYQQKFLGCEVLSRLDLDRTDGVFAERVLQVIKRDKELCVKFDLYTFKNAVSGRLKMRTKISVTCNFFRVLLFLSENSASDIIDIAQKNRRGFLKRIIIEIEDGHTDGGFEILRANTALLKKSGFKICLDDFGKGNTALGELSELMPDIIGIDKSVLYGAKNDCGEAVFGGAVRLAKRDERAGFVRGYRNRGTG